MMAGNKVLFIIGPTASGKSDLAFKLAEKLNTEIISADSRQIYKHLNIGTAKPSFEQLKKIKHHFIDELELNENFNASVFEQRSDKIIESLFEQNKIPIVVGGTGLYIRALLNGISDIEDIDYNLRVFLMKEREEFGNDYIFEKLKKLDPVSAKNMLPQNWKRVIRALEVIIATGKPIWQFHLNYKKELNFNPIIIGLSWERQELNNRIEIRVDHMIKTGLVDECKWIIQIGYDLKLNALNTVGYKEIFQYLYGAYDLNEAVRLIKRNTKHYAKRQLTWFKKEENIIWEQISSDDELNKLSEKIITNYLLN